MYHHPPLCTRVPSKIPQMLQIADFGEACFTKLEPLLAVALKRHLILDSSQAHRYHWYNE